MGWASTEKNKGALPQNRELTFQSLPGRDYCKLALIAAPLSLTLTRLAPSGYLNDHPNRLLQALLCLAV